MHVFIGVLLLIFPFLHAFIQHEYRVIHERIELVSYNKSYLENPKMILFYYNRTMKVFNISGTIKEDLGEDVTQEATAYKFLSNEYRLFPVVFKGNNCFYHKHDVYGTLDTLRFGNVTLCPIKKGTYYLANAYMDERKLPPNVPRGRFKLNMKTYYHKNILLFEMNWYGQILDYDWS